MFRSSVELTCRLTSAALVALLLGWLVPTAIRAGELGAFFAPSTMSAFERGPRQGARIALKPGTAYSVIGLGWESGDRLWLHLSVPEHPQAVRGDGWTPLTAEELAARGTAPVEIYTRPVEPGQAPASGPASVQVPANLVRLRGEGEASKTLPKIVWRPLRYATQRAEQPWIAAGQGVYRPGRTPVFLMAVYQEMVAKQVSREALGRLLAGVVRKGDSAQDVRWAWGEPLRTWNESAGAQKPDAPKQAVWEYAEGQLRFAGAAVAEVR